MKETERKFLIRYPDRALLLRQPGAGSSRITQTYLLSENGESERVRCREYEDRTIYRHTVKRPLSPVSCEEIEVDIPEEEYRTLLLRKDDTREPIRKERVCIPYGGHTLEIDLYPFWQNQAVLEIELRAEDEPYAIPPYLTVIREVTEDRAYKNRALAKSVPPEDPVA